MTPRRPQTLRPLRQASHQLYLHFYDAGGTERLLPADQAHDMRFETCLPARDFPTYEGQQHTPGAYWAASSDTMLDYDKEIRIWIGNDFGTVEQRGRHFYEVVTDRGIISTISKVLLKSERSSAGAVSMRS